MCPTLGAVSNSSFIFRNSPFLEIIRPLSDYLGNSGKLIFNLCAFIRSLDALCLVSGYLVKILVFEFLWNFMGLRSKLIKLGNSYCNIGAQTPDYPRLA